MGNSVSSFRRVVWFMHLQSLHYLVELGSERSLIYMPQGQISKAVFSFHVSIILYKSVNFQVMVSMCNSCHMNAMYILYDIISHKQTLSNKYLNHIFIFVHFHRKISRNWVIYYRYGCECIYNMNLYQT